MESLPLLVGGLLRLGCCLLRASCAVLCGIRGWSERGAQIEADGAGWQGRCECRHDCGSPRGTPETGGPREGWRTSGAWQSGLLSAGFRSALRLFPPAAKPCPLWGLGRCALFPWMPLSRVNYSRFRIAVREHLS